MATDITAEIKLSVEAQEFLAALEVIAARLDEIMNSPEVKALIAIDPELWDIAQRETVNDLAEKRLAYEKRAETIAKEEIASGRKVYFGYGANDK